MAKRSWWLQLLKNLITCEPKPKTENKGKTKTWKWVFSRFRLKQLPTTTPSSKTFIQENKSLCDAREEQRKIAMNVARATAAAAEAAVQAAQAAAEVVRLTGMSRDSSLRMHEKDLYNLAATKIQSAFKGYLARKALRALKGVVRIQAIARGRAVRRRFRAKFKKQRKCIHPTEVVQTRRVPSTVDDAARTKNDVKERLKLECKSQRQWTDSLFSKEEIESIYLQKQQATFRRERMEQYSFSNRERHSSQTLEEITPLRNNARQTCLRKKWVDANFLGEGYSKGSVLELHDSDTTNWDLGANLRIKPKTTRNLAKEDSNEEVSSPLSYPRRSLCDMRLKQGTEEDCQLSNRSCMFPTYMAVTESTKAKMRSMSTPRQRLRYLDTCFEQYESPCKSRLSSSWSSFNGE